jgi:proline iminopeptidase
MTERRIPVPGTTLFVDDRGAADAPVVLYAHGGPGQSCYDFMKVQGDRLAQRLRFTGVDQRGLLRSDPLPDGELVSPQTVVADYEALREALDIDRWTLLAASAGAGPGLDYAVARPDVVTAAVFDCPAWDGDLTDRHRLQVAADLLERYGKPDVAARCRRLAARPAPLTAADDTRGLFKELDDHYMEIYFHDLDKAAAFDAIWDDFDEPDPQRGHTHRPILEDMYRSRLDLLGGLRVPTLLVRGEDDLVTPPAVLERYLSDVQGARVHTIAEAGHFPSHEQPDEYADVVTAFVTEHAR